MMADKAEVDINGPKYSVKQADAASNPVDIVIDSIKYAINMTRISIPPSTDGHSPTNTYHVSASRHYDKTGALVDLGANGGIARADCHVIEETSQFVNIEGINNHMME